MWPPGRLGKIVSKIVYSRIPPEDPLTRLTPNSVWCIFNQLCQILFNLVLGFSFCRGSKFGSSHRNEIAVNTELELLFSLWCTSWLRKCPTGQTKCNFSTTDRDFLPKSQDLQWKEFSTILENFTDIFSLLQELQLLQYFIPQFKIMPKKWTVTCNVQCSMSLNSFFLKVRSKYPFRLSHKLDVLLWSSVWPYWLSESCGSWSHINCKTFFSPSVFFGLERNVL